MSVPVFFKMNDIVTVTDSGDKKFKIVQIKPMPGGTLYLCESEDGVRIQRFAVQLRKVES